MKFSEFKGNERAVFYFQKVLTGTNLGHAFLFSGQDGVGKYTLARLVCAALLCREPAADGPCGRCPSCHKLETGNHPDFHEFAPEGLYFKIDQVREIIHLASLKPVESTWKTFVLLNVEYMREEASNALLKVLEEPPGKTVFFLITEAPEVLLSTIRSRCQHFPFQPLPQAEVEAWLVGRRGMTQEEALGLARYSHGSIGRALGVNVERYREMRDRVLLALETALTPRSYFAVIDAVKGITVERSEMPERLLIMEELICDLLRLKTAADASLVHEDVRSRLFPLAGRAGLHSLQQFYEELLETRECILKINANTGLSLQALFLPLRAKHA